MNQTEQLLQMLEHPHDYTDDEWQQMLQDDECRELYMLMAKTRGAFDAACADEKLTDEAMDAEWQRLEDESALRPTSHFTLHKAAASFIGLLLVSGIAFAAIHLVRGLGQTPAQEKSLTAASADSSVTEQRHSPVLGRMEGEAAVVYDNIPLEKMLPEIAARYDATVVFHSDEARQLRFHFVWNPQKGIGQVVSDLNQFERPTVTLKDQQIIVE